LPELKAVFEEDARLELNVSKTSILPKGVSAQAAFDVAQTIMQATPALAHLSNDVLLPSFCPEGFVGIGVPIGTDAFVQKCLLVLMLLLRTLSLSGNETSQKNNRGRNSGRIKVTVHPISQNVSLSLSL
jgi:hypothetical protein